ncbi:hypothetical protein PU02_0214 [Bartonella ancashensis]|uniref:Uncharacterized protein n=1 Tax=Bartonella ancashensis TaxID=1318743 RepID=A0A0M5KSC0_9HYPH|nr:hypothetical protein PU02_0214 [Bartonella ancashensis]
MELTVEVPKNLENFLSSPRKISEHFTPTSKRKIAALE